MQNINNHNNNQACWKLLGYCEGQSEKKEELSS